MDAMDAPTLAGQPRPAARPTAATTNTARRGGRFRRWLELLAVPFSLALGILGWKWLVVARDIPAFILPPPERVATRFVSAVADGTWWTETRVTLIESLLGFALAFVVACVLGYLLAHIPLLERLIGPYIPASQALPIIAIAPLLILWLGYGLASKIVAAALLVFFPMLINIVSGLRRIEPSLREVAQVYGANRLQILRHVEIPLALPTILSGIKISFTLAVTGATVAEFMGADRGLGVLLSVASRGLFDTALVFVALLTLVALAMLAYGFVSILERVLIRW
jgi:NitT/TauT family transport system permease protein